MQNDRGGDEDRQQVDARRILLDEHVRDQADIQVLVRTVCTKVAVRITILDQVEARLGLNSIETQVQMSAADTRQDQESACQDEQSAS